MNNIAVIFQLTRKDIFNSKYYRRLILCFFIFFSYYILGFTSAVEYARELGLRINVLEPALILLSKITSPIIMGTLLFLICDTPFRDEGDYNVVYRVGRVRWLSAKILVMAYFITLFVLVALLASVIFTLRAPEFQLSFSDFAQLPHIDGVDSGRQLYFDENIINNYTLVEALLKSSLLLMLWGNILGMIITNSNLKYHRIIGIILACIPQVGDRILLMLQSFHKEGFLRYICLESISKGDFPTCVIVMLLIIFALIVLALFQVGKHSMQEKE